MTILVVDAMPVMYQAFNTVGHLSNSSGETTGVRYGFLRNIRSWAEKFKARKVVVVWDTPDPILKAVDMPAYKSNREDSPERKSLFAQIPDVKDMIALTFMTQVESPGYEADDLCYSICHLYAEKYKEPSVLVTVDRDSFSAVSEMVTVFLTANGQKDIIGQSEVWRHFGCAPKHVPAIKAMGGDKSDNIEPLIPVDLLESFKTFLVNNPDVDCEHAISQFFKVDDDLVSGGLLNLRTTKLHLVEADKWKVRKGEKDAGKLTDLFDRLEFKSMHRFTKQLTTEPTSKGMIKADPPPAKEPK